MWAAEGLKEFYQAEEAERQLAHLEQAWSSAYPVIALYIPREVWFWLAFDDIGAGEL